MVSGNHHLQVYDGTSWGVLVTINEGGRDGLHLAWRPTGTCLAYPNERVHVSWPHVGLIDLVPVGPERN